MQRASVTLCTRAVEDGFSALLEFGQLGVGVGKRRRPGRDRFGQSLDATLREQGLLERGKIVEHVTRRFH